MTLGIGTLIKYVYFEYCKLSIQDWGHDIKYYKDNTGLVNTKVLI